MKVILLRDVAKIGRRFEIKEVPDGYALNRLIPQKDAEPATPANVKRVLERRKGNVRTEEGLLEDAKAVVASCTDTALSLVFEANEQGHLFQAVHAQDITARLKERGLKVEASQLSFSSPIKGVGEHTVVLKAAGKEFIIPFSVEAKAK
jgi:large subunit ribosomal protein L9